MLAASVTTTLNPLVVGPGGSGKAESPVCADGSRVVNHGPPHK